MKKISIIYFVIIILHFSLPVYGNDQISSSNISDHLDPQKGIVSKWYDCGKDLKFMFLYQPVMTKSQSYQTAQGIFILFRVLIQNNSHNTISGLKNDSFSLLKEINGKKSVYPLSGGHSRITSKAWEINVLQDDIPALSQIDTFLVFDVEGKKDEKWVLLLSPVERGTDESICKIELLLPEIALH